MDEIKLNLLFLNEKNSCSDSPGLGFKGPVPVEKIISIYFEIKDFWSGFSYIRFRLLLIRKNSKDNESN
jgi:hypothetical protein